MKNLGISGFSSPFEESNESSGKPALTNFSSHIKTNKAGRRYIRDKPNSQSRNKTIGESMSNPNRAIKSPSSNSSYSSTRNTSKASNLRSMLRKRFGQNVTLNTPSRVSVIPFKFTTFETNKDICAFDEDYDDLYSYEIEFKDRINQIINIPRLDIELRENLICKIKKICDTYELSDEVFYNSVLLYDFQRMAKESRKFKDK